MRETHFIEQNKEKWAKFEEILRTNHKDPEELSNLFIDITDDLSYSRTFYPNRSVRVYLNNIAQRVFYSIYTNRKSRWKRFVRFWTETVPQIMYESRSMLFLALIIFFSSVLVGVFSSIMAPEFPAIILGQGYIEEALRNIARGEPMSVYQDADQGQMFFKIGFNNLRVAMTAFVLGLFFGIGSLYILMFNGVMVGAFQYFFIREGIYLDSILTIWLHGTIEISCIIIGCAAGLVLGKGLAFPGTYTRLQSLQLSARRGIMIMLTIIPLIILAAFIESFITRYTDAPYLLRGGIILASLAFVLLYFVWYPYRKAQRGFTSFVREVNLPPSPDQKIAFNRIKNSGQIFSDAFSIYGKHIKYLALASLILAAIYTAIATVTEASDQFAFQTTVLDWEMFFELIPNMTNNIVQFLFPITNPVVWWLNLFCTATMGGVLLFLVQYEQKKGAKKSSKTPLSYFLYISLAMFIGGWFILNLLIVDPGWIFLGILFIIPLLMLWQATVFNEGMNLFSSVGKMFSLLRGNWMVMMGAYLVMLLMCIVFLFLGTAPILSLYFDVIASILPFTEDQLVAFHQVFYTFIHAFLLCFLLPLLFVVISVGYYSFRETKEATDLFEQIPQIGIQKKSYGMEKE